MICPSMPIPASAELTEFLYILCRQELLHPLLAPPLCWRLWAYAPCSVPTLLAATDNYVVV